MFGFWASTYMGGIMPGLTSLNTRGLTVLALLLLILAVIVAAFFLVPYLQSR